ncbi:GntR family transcriptional regulator [Streptomyces sp. NBC_00083]|uniref:GntR family transcriptional regulator n=1 Tax=Streptomyces sp. NBC_00083 TaxID=2975647 RepID=UPI002B1D766B|nr:GntR family transcriptional regulator [Streptomyces sp. NBC_00083]
MASAVAPRRHVIAHALRAQISTGHVNAGERHPSEAQLVARYTVSTSTLRNALALLQAEGPMEKVHGKGTSCITLFAESRTSAAAAHRRTRLCLSIRTTKLRACGHLATLLRVPTVSPLTEYLSLSHGGELPCSLARVRTPRNLASADVPSASSGVMPVEAPLDKPHLPWLRCENEKHPPPDTSGSDSLQISPALVLKVTRISPDITGRIIEAALLISGARADAVFQSAGPLSPGRHCRGHPTRRRYGSSWTTAWASSPTRTSRRKSSAS